MSIVASRYARVLAEVVAHNKIEPESAVSQLNQIAELVETSTALRNVLRSPSVPQRQKLALLDQIFSRTGGDRPMRNFVAVLVDQRRIGQIGEIALQFRKELDDRLGIVDAQISSSRELSAAEKKALEQQMAAITGKIIRAGYSQDASLLGGAVVRVGSTIYDGSVRGRLKKIRQEISGS